MRGLYFFLGTIPEFKIITYKFGGSTNTKATTSSLAWRVSVQSTCIQEEEKNALKLKLQLLIVKRFSNILEKRNHEHGLFVHLLIVCVCEIHVAFVALSCFLFSFMLLAFLDAPTQTLLLSL